MAPHPFLVAPKRSDAPHLLQPTAQDQFLLGLAPTIGVLVRRDGSRCWMCGVPLEGRGARFGAPPDRDSPTRDHVIPSVHAPGKKPIEVHWNLRPACHPCNVGKGARVPHWAHLRWDLIAPDAVVQPTLRQLQSIRKAASRAANWWPTPLPPPLVDFLYGAPPPYASALAMHLPD